MKRKLNTARWGLALAVGMPFLVGFAPADSAGNFVSLGGGRGVYPSASCSYAYANRYSEGAAAFDKTIDTRRKQASPEGHGLRPEFVTLGAFGGIGQHEKTIVYSEDGSDVGKTEKGPIGWYGVHAALDWKWVGLDLGGGRYDLPGTHEVLPRLGLRLGTDVFHLYSTFAGGMPLLSDGGLLALGFGGKVRGTRLSAELDAGPMEGGFALRARRGFGPLAAGLTLSSGFPSRLHGSEGLAGNYGVAVLLQFRLPGS